MNEHTLISEDSLATLPKGALVAFSAFCSRQALVKWEAALIEQGAPLDEIKQALTIAESAGSESSLTSENLATLSNRITQLGDHLPDPLDAVAWGAGYAVMVVVRCRRDENDFANEGATSAWRNACYADSTGTLKNRLEQNLEWLHRLSDSENWSDSIVPTPKQMEAMPEEVAAPARCPRVFVSYSSLDRGAVSLLIENLTLMGLSYWWDKYEIPAIGRDYEKSELESRITSGIESSDALIIFVDDRSLNSDWVSYEIQEALRHRRSENTDYVVIPLVNDTFKADTPEPIIELSPILMSSGYNTALSQINARIMGYTNPPRVGLTADMQRFSRHLRGRARLEVFMRSSAIPENEAEILMAARDCIARLEKIPSHIELVELLGDISASSGNTANLDLTTLPFPPEPDAQSLVLVFSTWTGDQPAFDNVTSLWADITENGIGTLTLVTQRGVHRFTLGSERAPSVLIEEDIKMGAERYCLLFPVKEMARDLSRARQQLANKLGLGQVQIGQSFDEPDSPIDHLLWGKVQAMEHSISSGVLPELTGLIAEVVNQIQSMNWEMPEGSQSGIAFGHMRLGGILIFERSVHMGPPGKLFGIQLLQMCIQSGAEVYETPLEDGTGYRYLSISRLLSGEFQDLLDKMR